MCVSKKKTTTITYSTKKIYKFKIFLKKYITTVGYCYAIYILLRYLFKIVAQEYYKPDETTCIYFQKSIANVHFQFISAMNFFFVFTYISR